MFVFACILFGLGIIALVVSMMIKPSKYYRLIPIALMAAGTIAAISTLG